MGLIGPETENGAEFYVMRCSIWLLKLLRTWWSGYVAHIGEVKNKRVLVRRLEERGPFILRQWKGVP